MFFVKNNLKSCVAVGWRHDIVQRFWTGIYLFPIFSCAAVNTFSQLHHNEQLPLCAAICAGKKKIWNISRYQCSQRFRTSIFLEPNVASDRHSSRRLQLLSCCVSCRRFDRFHFTLSHWQRRYKQVQITKKYMKVKKKKTATEETVKGLRYWNYKWWHLDASRK